MCQTGKLLGNSSVRQISLIGRYQQRGLFWKSRITKLQMQLDYNHWLQPLKKHSFVVGFFFFHLYKETITVNVITMKYEWQWCVNSEMSRPKTVTVGVLREGQFVGETQLKVTGFSKKWINGMRRKERPYGLQFKKSWQCIENSLRGRMSSSVLTL